MIETMREPTLSTLDLGNVMDIFKQGKLPASEKELVDQVFGSAGDRGALVISGANGIVGAGKAMQLGARLQSFDIPIVALDFPGVPDGIGRKYPQLASAFSRSGANKIMENIIALNYDGTTLPKGLKKFSPRFLLEAIPEVLEIKKSHYKLFKEEFSGIEIRSVTSGFPSSQLGVPIAHPAFPHEINKVFEIVEDKTSPVTQLFWALGLIPLPMGDYWSFVLDVLFCGLTLAGLRYAHASNMPYWKIDKYIRKHYGPNPFRAHDVIGAKGANFLTWSCLHHLAEQYGELFRPGAELEERRISGQDWYPMNHFRPLVDWHLDIREEAEFKIWLLGNLIQMTSLLLHERRAHLSYINSIGEICAQFRRGILALIRSLGATEAVKTVEAFHKIYPAAAGHCWYPSVLEQIEEAGWQQLYVNAEHDGMVGTITLGRESYNWDVDQELNRAIDWLKVKGIDRVILTGDFHISTQLVGADTSDFYPALEEKEKGYLISRSWSRTARRLEEEFAVSVGYIGGKRCLGGMLELMMHCHYLVSENNADLGMPEVTLPVVPGMEGCHWPFRKSKTTDWPKLLKLFLEGRFIKAKNARGWLADYTGTESDCIKMVWEIVTGGDHGIKRRKLVEEPLRAIPVGTADSTPVGGPQMQAGREAIFKCIHRSCNATLGKALEIQAEHSAEFMSSRFCQQGQIGQEFRKTVFV